MLSKKIKLSKSHLKANLVWLIFLTALFLLLYFLYQTFFSVFFVQDDFFLLSISRARTLGEFLFFFLPRQDTVWYRPLSQQIFFWSVQSLFGLSPIAFHKIIFSFHFLNFLLIFYLLRVLFKTNITPFFSSLIYFLHPAHFLSLAWPAAFGFVLGPTATILTYISYLRFLDSRRRYWYLLGFFFFIIALLSTEATIILVPILFFLQILISKKKISLSLLCCRFAPFVLTGVAVLLLRYVWFRPEQISGEYQIILGVETIQSIIWYGLRFIALMPGIRLDNWVVIILIITNLAITVKMIFSAFQKQREKIDKLFFWGCLVIVISLLPFLLTPKHISPHYLSFSLIGGVVALSSILNRLKNEAYYPLLTWSLFISFLAISIISNSWNFQTHWLVKRARLAKSLIEQGIYQVPNVSEEYFALGANYADDVFSNR